MTDAFVIETAGLQKNYGGIAALKDLSLQVPAGAVCGFLGRNGAGKTTLIKVLMGMVRPTAGAASVFGLDARRGSVEIRRRTGFVSEDRDLFDYMTVGEMIRFTAAFYPRWRSDLERRYLAASGMPVDRKVKALSRGMRSTLALLLAMCRGAELLILDEPTSGLDPAMSEEVLQLLITHVAGQETTVFFSSHNIAEVEQIADHVAIVHGGRSVLAGSSDDLRQSFCRVELVFDGEAPEPVFRCPGVRRVRRRGRALTVLSSAGPEAVIAEMRALNPVSVDVVPVTLKEIFLDMVAVED